VNATIDRLRGSELAVRARMAGPLARVTAGRSPSADALERALKTTLLGRIPAAERAWIERIEARRSELSADHSATGSVFDPGTEGPEGLFTNERPATTVAAGATMMSLSPPWCVFLMRLVRELGPVSCLELGAGFGISSSYQAAALELNGAGRLTSLEGAVEWAELAATTHGELGLERVEMRVGPIAETLGPEVERARPIDYAFIDAEHQAEATLQHFETLLPGLAGGAYVVFDDVNWAEMRAAHDEISRHERVSASVVVGRLGVTVVGRTEGARGDDR
jgi:predicted O-methyltransferase YrrM